MDPVLMMVVVLVVLLLFRAPISIALVLSSLTYFLLSSQPVEIVAQRIIAGVDSFPLMAIPMFVLAGTVMARGGIAHAILSLADALVGHWRGGLAQVNVLNSVLMGGMTGSAYADAATDAKILVPVMRRKGYSNEFASALSAASGLIAPIIPPGIGLVLYAIIAQVSVGRLFLGAVVPAALLAVAMIITVAVIARRRGYKSDRDRRASLGVVLRALLYALPALAMPVLLIVGLRFGVFTVTELAAAMAILSLLIAMVVYRKITWRNLPQVLRESIVASGMVMLLIAGGAAFGNILTRERLPQDVTTVLTSFSDNWVVTIIIVNLLLLVLGMFLDGAMIIIMLTPILAVTAAAVGMDPIHFGVIMVVNITLGGISPPIGGVLLTVVGITNAPLGKTFREVTPFLLAAIVVLFLISFLPELVTWLPDAVMG
jgi:tripartite ATP-independent transporter DctM subunit